MDIKGFYGFPPVKGDVGIEIEMEGDCPFPPARGFWRSEEDGSLRGHSIEYVLRQPITSDKVDKVLDTLYDVIKKEGCNIKYSFRAGVHIHVNVQDLSFYDAYKFGVVYYILEPVLLEWCGPDREANLFCLGLQQANYNILAMTREINDGRRGDGAIASDRVRYAALNWTSLGKYGSMEFRSLGTQPTFDNIKQWISILLAIRDASLNYSTTEEILLEFSNLSPEKWAKKILGDNYELVRNIPDLASKIYEGLWEIQDFASAVDRNSNLLKGEINKPELNPYVMEHLKLNLNKVRPRNIPMPLAAIPVINHFQERGRENLFGGNDRQWVVVDDLVNNDVRFPLNNGAR